MCWLAMGCALTARQRPKSDCRLATSRACARTIGPRIRINRLDDASGRCSVSNRPDRPNGSCLFTPPSKTRSTSNAISHPAARSASSETKRSGRGEPPPRPEPELRLPIFTRPKFSSRDSAAWTFNRCAWPVSRSRDSPCPCVQCPGWSESRQGRDAGPLGESTAVVLAARIRHIQIRFTGRH
jgi:hypothetical protein